MFHDISSRHLSLIHPTPVSFPLQISVNDSRHKQMPSVTSSHSRLAHHGLPLTYPYWCKPLRTSERCGDHLSYDSTDTLVLHSRHLPVSLRSQTDSCPTCLPDIQLHGVQCHMLPSLCGLFPSGMPYTALNVLLLPGQTDASGDMCCIALLHLCDRKYILPYLPVAFQLTRHILPEQNWNRMRENQYHPAVILYTASHGTPSFHMLSMKAWLTSDGCYHGRYHNRLEQALPWHVHSSYSPVRYQGS